MLLSPLTALEFELDAILRKKMNKRLFSTKQEDLLRLMKLKLWSIRYAVSLEYILERLVPYYEKLASRHYVRRTAGPSKGLGVSIAVLTGPAAEEKLQEFIRKDFPDDEHIADARESAKSKCLELMDKQEFTGRPRPILHYSTVSEFVESYSSRIDRSRRSSARLEKKMSKQSYRGNPFR